MLHNSLGSRVVQVCVGMDGGVAMTTSLCGCGTYSSYLFQLVFSHQLPKVHHRYSVLCPQVSCPEVAECSQGSLILLLESPHHNGFSIDWEAHHNGFIYSIIDWEAHHNGFIYSIIEWEADHHNGFIYFIIDPVNHHHNGFICCQGMTNMLASLWEQ